jgi:hypothetical protein
MLTYPDRMTEIVGIENPLQIATYQCEANLFQLLSEKLDRFSVQHVQRESGRLGTLRYELLLCR